ncbi:MAG: secretin N-terminal domain-containing protein [Planctomycetota bacterium]
MKRLLPVLILFAACQAPAGPSPAAQPSQDLHMQVVRLQHAGAEDVAMTLRQSLSSLPGSGGGCKVVAQPEQNAVVLSGTAEQVRSMLELTASLDSSPR